MSGVKTDGRSTRWYRHAEVVAEERQRRFLVELDGRRILTPRMQVLSMPSESVAMLVAAEWESQEKTIKPHTMPFMTLATSAVDEAPVTRAVMVANIISFLGSDTACIRAGAPEVARLQATHFDPLIDWFQQRFAAPLQVQHGLLGVLSGDRGVAEETEAAVQWPLFDLSDYALVALESLSQCTKSAVLALALLEGRVTAKQAADWSRLEEQHQIDAWGHVPGPSGTDLDEADLYTRISSAVAFLRLCPKTLK